jgi:hypothetical protein
MTPTISNNKYISPKVLDESIFNMSQDFKQYTPRKTNLRTSNLQSNPSVINNHRAFIKKPRPEITGSMESYENRNKTNCLLGVQRKSLNKFPQIISRSNLSDSRGADSFFIENKYKVHDSYSNLKKVRHIANSYSKNTYKRLNRNSISTLIEDLSQTKSEIKEHIEEAISIQPNTQMKEWPPIENIHINNINCVDPEKTVFLFDPPSENSQEQSKNSNEESKWWHFGMKNVFDKNKSSKNNPVKMNFNDTTDYKKVKENDLRKLLTAEQINAKLDKFLLMALMEWEANEKIIITLPPRVRSSRTYSSLQKNHSSAISSYTESVNGRILQNLVYHTNSYSDLYFGSYTESLRKKMEFMTPFYKMTKQKQIGQQILNFSAKELEIIFSENKNQAIGYIFRKYRGLLDKSELKDNIFVIEKQINILEDKIVDKGLSLQQQNKNILNYYWNDSSTNIKRAAKLILDIKKVRKCFNRTTQVLFIDIV